MVAPPYLGGGPLLLRAAELTGLNAEGREPERMSGAFSGSASSFHRFDLTGGGRLLVAAVVVDGGGGKWK